MRRAEPMGCPVRIHAACRSIVLMLVLALPASGGLASAAPPGGAADEQAGAPRVEIYTTPSCAYCKMLRKYLQARGIEYIEHNINATQESRAAFYASGAHGVPVVVIGARRIQGFNPLRIEAALREAQASTQQD